MSPLAATLILFVSLILLFIETNCIKYDLDQAYQKKNFAEKARQIRADFGHYEGIPYFQEILKNNPNDFTASTRLAAAKSSPRRHDSFFFNQYHFSNTSISTNSNNKNIKKDPDSADTNDLDFEANDNTLDKIAKDVVSLRHLLHECGFTHHNIKRLFGVDKIRGFASGPIYAKPVTTGKNGSGLPLGISDNDDDAINNDPLISLKCLVSMFILGYSIPRSILSKSLPSSSSKLLELLESLGLVFPCELNPEILVPYVQLFPLDLKLPTLSDIDENCDIKNEVTLIFATDWHPDVLGTTTVGENNDGAVMYIGPDSLGLVQHISKPLLQQMNSSYQSLISEEVNEDNTTTIETTKEIIRILDLCSGSGIQAISTVTMISHYLEKIQKKGHHHHISIRATCSDINPRALKFIQFNSLLNGYKLNVENGNAMPSKEGIAGIDISIDTMKLDLLSKHDRSKFMKENNHGINVILANPPFIPTPNSYSMQSDTQNGKVTNDTLLVSNDNKDCVAESSSSMTAESSEGSIPNNISPEERVSKRYGLFSSGGTDGEIVLQEIIKFSSDLLWKTADQEHLRFGLVFIVSEFVDFEQEKDITSRFKYWWGRRRRNNSNEVVKKKAKGILFTNEYPVLAEEYSNRRSGTTSGPYKELWYQHMVKTGIKSVSPGFLFLLSDGVNLNNDTHNQVVEKRIDDDEEEEGLTLVHRKVPKSEMGSVWTPWNKIAVDFVSREWDDFMSGTI